MKICFSSIIFDRHKKQPLSFDRGLFYLIDLKENFTARYHYRVGFWNHGESVGTVKIFLEIISVGQIIIQVHLWHQKVFIHTVLNLLFYRHSGNMENEGVKGRRITNLDPLITAITVKKQHFFTVIYIHIIKLRIFTV